MSYTYNVKEEILNNEMITNIEKTAEISAVLLSKNAFYDDKIELRLENLALAKRVYKFIKDITSLKIEIKYQISKRLGEQVPGCQLNTVEKIQVAKQLEALGVDVPERVINRPDGIPERAVVSPRMNGGGR